MKKIIALILSIFLLASCSNKAPEVDPIIEIDEKYQTMWPQEWDIVAIMHTNVWDIKIRLFKDVIPLASNNFIALAQKWYYNWTSFHRVIENFMIQWGDPTWTWAGWESIFWTPFKDEFNENLKNIPWALSMANAWPGTNWSQFFIIHNAPQPHLNWVHTVFGQVYEWMDTVDKIATMNKEIADPVKTVEKVVINSIDIKEIIDWVESDTSYKWEKMAKNYLSNIEVKEWDTVTLDYELKIEWDNKVVETTFDSDDSFSFITGQWQVIPWFEKALIWMKINSEKEFTLAPKDAYGEYDENQKVSFSKNELLNENKDSLKVWDLAKTQYWDYKISYIWDDVVELDANNPLAWKTLSYRVKILWIK